MAVCLLGLLPGVTRAVVPVLPPEAGAVLPTLLDDVGWDRPLEGGVRFDSIRIDKDSVTIELRRDEDDAPVVGRLLLSPGAGALGLQDPAPGESASFAIHLEPLAPEEPAVTRWLEAARQSVIAHDPGGLYLGVQPPPSPEQASSVAGERTDSGRAGVAIAALLGAPKAMRTSLRAQLRFPIAVLALLALLVAVARAHKGPFTFGRRFSPTHLLPVLIQVSVYTYWSLYWRGVGEHAHVLLLQLVFAFLFDVLWSLLTRHRWVASFAPLPVVLSANLFVWFTAGDQWLGFLVVAAGLAGKTLFQRDGRHVFNPSAFGLFVVGALYLVAPDWFGYEDIAFQLALPPSMIEVIVLAVLVAQLRVPIVLVSIAAAIPLAWGEHLTGWQLLSPYYPPVLIIILALATDPATIPRTGGGRILFGLFVGAGIHLTGIALTLYVGMDYWAKVLPIPIANALVPWFDRMGARLPERIDAVLTPHRNRLHIVAWVLLVVYGLWIVEVKQGVFAPEAHLGYGTRHVVVGPDGPTCALNPAFCEPFAWGEELRLWTSEAGEQGRIASP